MFSSEALNAQRSARLANDHADLGKLLAEVYAALDAGDIGRSHERLDLFWARLAMHIRAEHLHLFPAILHALSLRSDEDKLAQTELQDAIKELHRDHDFFMRELVLAIASMRKVMNTKEQIDPQKVEQIRATLFAVEQRLAAHNRLEEDQIYGCAETLLSETEQAALARGINQELRNLPPRFAGSVEPN
jgi:hemerythrin superfamily protein